MQIVYLHLGRLLRNVVLAIIEILWPKYQHNHRNPNELAQIIGIMVAIA